MPDDARIIYDTHRIDIGDILEKFDLRLMTPKSQAKSLGEAVQVINWGNYHAGEIVFKLSNDYATWHQFKNFWAWASKGYPFTFAREKTKDYIIYLDAEPDDKEYVKDGDFEIWASAADTLVNWTKVETGSTTINKEPDIDHVKSKLACVRIDNDLANMSYIHQTSADSLPASAAGRISLFYKSNDDTKGTVSLRIKNNTTGNWLKNDNTWQATEQSIYTYDAMKDDDDATFGVGKARWRRAHFDFNNDTSAGTLYIKLASLASGSAASKDYVDKLSIRCRNKVIPLQSTYGIAANDYLWIQSRKGHGEIVKVSSISAGVSITCVDPLQNDYEVGDFVRYRDTYELIADDRQTEEPMIEEPGLEFTFRMKVREYRTGRS